MIKGKLCVFFNYPEMLPRTIELLFTFQPEIFFLDRYNQIRHHLVLSPLVTDIHTEQSS